MKLTVTEIQAWLDRFAEEILKNKEYLSDLDTPIGDGDHGNNMARGMNEYRQAVEKERPATISDTFKQLSMILISKVGGASGPLYGSAFMNMTKATKDLDEITDEKKLGEIFAQGLQGIQARGKAVAGDKTMVDVWIPAVKALEEEKLDEGSIQQAKEATKDLQAKKGRASYLGERSIGHIDPGAASSAILFTTLVETFKN